MSQVIRVRALLTVYRWVAFAGPRTTTGVGSALVAVVGAAQVALLVTGRHPAYLDVWFGVAGALALLSLVAMVGARSRAVARLGWSGGSLVCAASIGLYVASRTAGLPGLDGAVGRWDHPGATAVLGLAALFLLLHTSLLLGVTVAVPERRRWHD